MKIGFFGDSFCMEFDNIHSEKYKYQTYLTMIKNYYSADVVNLGVGGSSVWDVIINQFPIFLDNLPDVCIFCWTDSNRLYHKSFRSLTGSSVLNLKEKDFTEQNETDKDIFDAAKQYFLKLHDFQKADIEKNAALHYFDDFILSKIKDKTKIIHLWSFEKTYNWNNGVEVSTPLNSIAALPNLYAEEDFSPNHLGDENKNQKAFELLVPAISF